MLHFPRGVAFGVNVGDFLQLQGTFECDGVLIFSTDIEEMSVVRVLASQLPNVIRLLQDFPDLVGQGLEAA